MRRLQAWLRENICVAKLNISICDEDIDVVQLKISIFDEDICVAKLKIPISVRIYAF